MKVSIVPFKTQLAKKFYDLNIEWLKTYFYVEPYDEEVLSQPKKYIIDRGGHIFFAEVNGEIFGTLALMPTNQPDQFELTKMAVKPEARGKRIGQHLIIHSIDFAKSQGWKQLILYSNTKLENAIHIYRKYGFKEIDVEPNSPYKRSNIKMILGLIDNSF